MLLFSNRFQYPYRFSVSIENHPCNRTKEKKYKHFVNSCNIFPVINEHINTILYLLRNFSDACA